MQTSRTNQLVQEIQEQRIALNRLAGANIAKRNAASILADAIESRDRCMVLAKDAGCSIAEICAEVGLSRDRVTVLIREYRERSVSHRY